jgi:hypothetical protein
MAGDFGRDRSEVMAAVRLVCLAAPALETMFLKANQLN